MRLRVKLACLLLLQDFILVESKLVFSKAKDGFVIRYIFNVALNDCKTECLQRSLCHSISYRRTSKACELNQKTDEARIQTRVGWIYSEKSSFVDATFSQCKCQDGEKCIVSPDGHTCEVEECETWAAQGRSNVASVGARSEHVCVLDIAKFDADRDSNKYVTPFVCASDGKWRPSTELSSTCYLISFVLSPNSNTDPYFAWVNGDNAQSDLKCLRSQSCQQFYRSGLIDLWNSLSINKVRFSVFKNQNEEQYIVFNGAHSSYINWFSHARVSESSWSDLVNTAPQLQSEHGYHFNIVGITFPSNSSRRFYINKLFNGCPADVGWFSTIYSSPLGYGPCSWEKRQSSILYSTFDSAVVFNLTAQADKVYVMLDLTEYSP